MIEKRMRIEYEKHTKEIDSQQEFERKQKNLANLFSEIRLNREHEAQAAKKNKKKTKKKSKKTINLPLASKNVAEPEGGINEESYNVLYQEFKKIISKKNAKENIDSSVNNTAPRQESRERMENNLKIQAFTQKKTRN